MSIFVIYQPPDTSWPIAFGISISIVFVSCLLGILMSYKTPTFPATTYETLNFDQRYNDFELKDNSAYGIAR